MRRGRLLIIGGDQYGLADGSSLVGDAVFATTGSSANPHLPTMPGQAEFSGRALHVADYRAPRSSRIGGSAWSEQVTRPSRLLTSSGR